MNLVRLGVVIRALRRRLRWRQLDLASKAGVSQQAISRLERAVASRMSLATIDRVLSVLGADLDLVVRWRGGELDRVLDAQHAALNDEAADLISSLAWQVAPEVSYSEYGERGSIDLFGLRPVARQLLVVEVKSDLTVIEATIRKHDEKVRLAPRIAQTRFVIDGPVTSASPPDPPGHRGNATARGRARSGPRPDLPSAWPRGQDLVAIAVAVAAGGDPVPAVYSSGG